MAANALHIVIIGAGNVASHLCRAFDDSEHKIVQLYNRSEKGKELANEYGISFTTNINDLVKADIYLVAIPDDAVSSFANKFPYKQSLIAHTSGSVSIEALNEASNRTGVFYPLQTFTKNKLVDFKTIPICIEAKSDEDEKTLYKLGIEISSIVKRIDSEKRKLAHVAAVFANNFSNHMYEIAYSFLMKNNLPFDLIQPLIKETADKVQHETPYDAQTGPAKRGDNKTIEAHLELLKNKEYQEIYKLVSESIKNTHGG